MVTPLSNANQPEQVVLYQGGQVISGAAQFNGRVGFVVMMPSTSASIFINNTQLSDTGTYQCLVNNLPDRGGRNIGVIGLTVLVPPSLPVCKVQGTLDIGSDITLTCSSEEGIPIPTYSWEKLEATPRLPPLSTQDQLHGTVTLRNISTATSGVFQCTALNAIGTSTCLIDLKVIAPSTQSVGLIVGIAATGVLVLIICLLLVATALFYWRNHRKYEEEEIPNEIREDDLPPKRSRSSSVKAFQGDASSSENDTLTSSNTYNSRYWNTPKASYESNSNSFNRYNGETQRSFSARSATGTTGRPAYTNGGHHHHPHQPKTLVVTANTSPSPQAVVRSNGSIGRKPQSQHTHSYAVSQATLERMGAVPIMVPAQSRVGSLV
uniref:Immunoglobulin superfamily member 11 n=2 Tax=Latimeria chalumnae TaxID=7897 RepID=H3AFZ3_LATCH